jgi:hypothetical protein
MVGTIDQFRANLIGGGARANQFKVEITNPPGIAAGLPTENAAFLCKTTNLPAMAVGEIALPFRGRQIYIAGDREFADAWTTTFLNDTNFAIRNAMERWQNGINDLALGTGVTISSEYSADLRVSQLDRDDQVLKVYLFRNAWPLSVGNIELSTETTNAIEEFEVTWRYQHFESSEVTAGLAAQAG